MEPTACQLHSKPVDSLLIANSLQVACRLAEIALQIRHIFRLPVDDDLSDQENVERPEVPVHGNYARQFGEAMATQGLLAGAPEEDEAEAEEEALLAAPAEVQAREVQTHCFPSVMARGKECWDNWGFAISSELNLRTVYNDV